MKNKIFIWAGIILIVAIVIVVAVVKSNQSQASYRIGWISDLTGPQAKYGAYEAGKLAEEQINANGGINGKPLDIIFEDGKCNGAQAVNAMNKLISIDKVDIVLGGHCSPESLAIAPVAEKSHVIMLAAITTSPGLSDKGQYVFRTSPVSTVQSSLISDLAFNKLGLKKFAVVYELTDYARPIAQSFKDSFTSLGGTVLIFEGYTAGTSDFRTILEKARSAGVDGIFVAPQSPDAGLKIFQQIKTLGISAKLFGNDVMANQTNLDTAPNIFEGMIIAMPDFDNVNNPQTKAMVDAYNTRWNTKALPYGVWTAESYDAVNIIADGLKKYGDNVDQLGQYLSTLSNYQGASGSITIDEHHNGVRQYGLRVVHSGKIEKY